MVCSDGCLVLLPSNAERQYFSARMRGKATHVKKKYLPLHTEVQATE